MRYARFPAFLLKIYSSRLCSRGAFGRNLDTFNNHALSSSTNGPYPFFGPKICTLRRRGMLQEIVERQSTCGEAQSLSRPASWSAASIHRSPSRPSVAWHSLHKCPGQHSLIPLHSYYSINIASIKPNSLRVHSLQDASGHHFSSCNARAEIDA